MMARQALGAAAKNVMANTRVTKAEADEMIAEFGSISNALRVFIIRWKREKHNDSKRNGEVVRPVR
jgi:hypothetical protein